MCVGTSHRPEASLRRMIVLAGAVAALSGFLTPAQESPREDRKLYTEGLQGVNLEGLTDEQRALALKVLNESDCLCGCRMTVAQCRVEDENCPRSPILARAIVDAVRRGENEEAVRAAYQATAVTLGASRGTATPPPPQPVFDFRLEGTPVRGNVDAPVTVVEFGDFQCPFCARSLSTLEDILAVYEGKVRLFYKHLPLPFHTEARLAAEAAEAANQQGKFWEMHDLLYSDPRAIDRERILGFAREIGLDLDKFQADWAGAQTRSVVDGDLAEAEKIGVNGTPTFFVNGRRLPNYRKESFRRAIDEALAASGGSEPGR